jgi:hypothetical protein
MSDRSRLPRKFGRVGLPPRPDETFETLDRPARGRRRKTGRTEQLNIRVQEASKRRAEELSLQEDRTMGALFDALLAAYETGGKGLAAGAVPASEARAGRTRELRAWASEEAFDLMGLIASECSLSVSALIEDLLAREVQRLDPGGRRFGFGVKR